MQSAFGDWVQVALKEGAQDGREQREVPEPSAELCGIWACEAAPPRSGGGAPGGCPAVGTDAALADNRGNGIRLRFSLVLKDRTVCERMTRARSMHPDRNLAALQTSSGRTRGA